MHSFEASRPRRSLPAIRRLVAAIVVLLAAESPALAADPTMFEGDRAHARARSDRRQGRTQTALSQPRHHGRRRSSPKSRTRPIPTASCLGGCRSPAGCMSVLGDIAVRGRSTEPTLLRGSLDDNLFDLAPADLARSAGIGRRGVRPRASAGAWRRCPDGVAPAAADRGEKDVRPAAVDDQDQRPRERAEIYADLSGKITLTNLRGTLRYERLDLRAGGPDLDELVQQIRDEIKDSGRSGMSRWRPNRSRSRPPSPAPRASRRSPGSPPGSTASARRTRDIPRLSFPGAEPTHVFSLSDVDWQRLPEMQQRARDSAASPTRKSPRSSC